MTTETSAAPASSAAAPAAAPAPAATPAAAESTPAAATPSTETSATPPAAGDSAPQDSGESAPAQGTPAPDADQSKPDGQPSDSQDPADTDKKDADGEAEGEGNQEAQPAYADFTLPEGLALDNDAMNEATPVLRELGASQEQAQKLVDVASTMLSKAAKNMADQHQGVVNQWRKETLEAFGKDGDAKFDERTGRAEEVVKFFFNEEQRSVLTHYGLGNHPSFFAMCLAIAEGTGEDRPFGGQKTGTKGEETLAQTWYPST